MQLTPLDDSQGGCAKDLHELGSTVQCRSVVVVAIDECRARWWTFLRKREVRFGVALEYG